MKNSYELGQRQFDDLLSLFSGDRDEAGEKYEQIRRGLVRFFQFKGCSDPESLADETINRVASKANEFDPSKNIKPVTFFYGFASNILLENNRRSRKDVGLDETKIHAAETVAEDSTDDAKNACLQRCLEQLPTDEKELIIKYYAREGRAKIELRQEMCERLNYTATALYTKIFRLKASLKGCIENCMEVCS